jgi:hypothetical protein
MRKLENGVGETATESGSCQYALAIIMPEENPDESGGRVFAIQNSDQCVTDPPTKNSL